jgi:hypothetical protein
MGESLAVWGGDETGSGESGECISSGCLSPALQKFKSFHFARTQYLCSKNKHVIIIFDACDTKLDLGPLIFAARCVPLRFTLISAPS